LRILSGIVFVFISFSLLSTVAFFLTAYVYSVTGWQPPPLVAQIINMLLGLCLFMAIIGGISYVFRHRRAEHEREVFGPIMRALEQIARGDFNVRLTDSMSDNALIGPLARSVNDMAAELDHMERMRQVFISDVSHEIQSPLTSIRGFARALQKEQLSSDERRHYLSIIETESMRLSRLSDNLLKLAALDSRRATFEPKTYRLDKQLRSLILASEPQWSAKMLEMDAVLDELSITADEDLLSQVWTNLIHNAVKFTPAGGTIRAELHKQGDRVVVALSDSGPGIPPADQPHIFERFYKADKSRERSAEGSGLGLAIAQKVVEIHKGTIGFDCPPSGGTTFTVTLPACGVDEGASKRVGE
jgi:two-component system phosphate regulon sensor histidine kinase PhoR